MCSEVYCVGFAKRSGSGSPGLPSQAGLSWRQLLTDSAQLDCLPTAMWPCRLMIYCTGNTGKGFICVSCLSEVIVSEALHTLGDGSNSAPIQFVSGSFLSLLLGAKPRPLVLS